MNRDSKGRFVKGHIPHTFEKHRSEATKQKLRLANLGKILLEETKRKISISCKKPNSGQFKKGQISPNKGKTKEISKSILSASLKRVGQKRKKYFINCPICNKEFNQFGIKVHIRFGHERDNPFKNKKHTEKAKQLNSKKHLGKISWNKDLSREKQPRFGSLNTEEQNKNISIGNKRKWQDWKNSGLFVSTATFEYDESWCNELREYIRNKYDRKCFDCGRLEKELFGYSKSLSVHHVDLDKLNCYENNLIPLCKSCHLRRHRKGIKILKFNGEKTCV